MFLTNQRASHLKYFRFTALSILQIVAIGALSVTSYGSCSIGANPDTGRDMMVISCGGGAFVTSCPEGSLQCGADGRSGSCTYVDGDLIIMDSFHCDQ